MEEINMKATAILNNYQLDTYHTQVVWEGLSKGDYDLLKRVVKNIKEVK